MRDYTLDHVSDDALLAEVAALVATDRQTTAALLAHLGEVEARRLFLPAACSSMHAYCTRVLHLSEDAAYKRIRAARAARRFPALFDAIADGRMHLSGVVALAPHVTDENVEALIAEAAHRSKAEIEILVARLAPRADLPTELTPLSRQAGPEVPLALGPVPTPPRAPVSVTGVKPLSPERFALQVTIDQTTRDKLERLQALLRHRNPSGDLAVVIDLAVDALLAACEKKKFGVTGQPREAKARPEDADPRYVANAVKRAVHERDGEQCSFVSASGERCTERGFLELDHRTPVARGGKPTVDGTRILCKAHNLYEAERVFGVDFMRAKREAAQVRRRHDQTPSAPNTGEDVGVPVASEDGESLDAEVRDALRGMGFKANETRRAMAQSASVRAANFEQRLRAALAALRTSSAGRCSEVERVPLVARPGTSGCSEGTPVALFGRDPLVQAARWTADLELTR